MEQRQNENRVAASKRHLLAEARALELEAKHPQISIGDPSPKPSEAQPMVGGGDAGLARVVGRGRRKKAAAAPSPRSPSPEMEEEGELSGGARHGKMLAEHLREMHGAGFLDDFAKGFMSVIKPVASIASFIPGPIGAVGKVVSGALGGAKPRKMRGGAGYAVEHSMMSPTSVGMPGSAAGGQDVPPGGIAPVAYGNVPQAPASFKRNTVGMGRAGGGRAGGAAPAGAGNLHIVHEGMGKPKRASARGQMVSKLMKEKGMTLGEASRYIKEHGGA